MTDTPEPKITDLQDPLPESNWFWRRLFTFAVVGITLAFLAVTLHALGHVAELEPRKGISALLEIANHLLMFAALLVLFYMVAPSAEQVVKMIHTAGLLKSGVQLATRALQEDGRTEVAQTAGRPPQPHAPTIQGHDERRGLPDEPSWSR